MTIRLFIFIALAAGMCPAQPPTCRDLQETGPRQRRDLSLPLSRLVLNFYDFKSEADARAYGTAANLPLHAAWLSTGRNGNGHGAQERFNRAIPELLTLYRAARPDFFGSVRTEEDSLAQDYRTAWAPHALSFSGRYASGAGVEGTEFLYDERTVVRALAFSGADDEFYIAGRFGGTAESRPGLLTVRNGHIRYTVRIPGGGRFELGTPPPGFRPTSGRGVCEAALGGAAAGAPQWWSCRVSTRELKGKRLAVAVRFSDEGGEPLEAPALDAGQVDEALARREAFWNSRLALAPEPLNTDLLKRAPALGVTPEAIRRAYYQAWVFTIQNVLPPDGARYPYPQLATGKASLWDEGEARAPFSAAWESFFGIQFYAFIDPGTAVEAFRGLMSMVDSEGVLGGESLPSRKAQTALVLYRLSGDSAMLREVYPALCRYMAWRMKITHWVYGDLRPNPHWKDAEFVFSAVIDMERLAEIAEVLGLPDEAHTWRGRRAAFFEESKRWFWATPAAEPIQNWCGTGPVPNPQDHAICLTTALYVDGLLSGPYLSGTMRRFDGRYDPAAPFAGFDKPKYPDISYTVYGLLRRGHPEQARGVMEACLRDVVRTGPTFAEQYLGEGLRPDGVRPSLFGSSLLIDFTMLLNGYEYDRGRPEAALTQPGEGGVAGIRIRGVPYRLTVSGGRARFGREGMMDPVAARVGSVLELPAACR